MACASGKWDHLVLKRWPHYLVLPVLLYCIKEKWLSGSVLLFFMFFFRSPDRITVNREPGALYSPADGLIMNIDSENENHVVRIYLSIADVHVQYAPTAAVVKEQRYKKGEFNVAYLMEKSIFNERLETNFQTMDTDCTVKVVQIAGQIAQRIESFVKKGDLLDAGCKIGIIKFGSRVDMYFPKSKYNIVAHVGEHVVGGESLLGRGNPPF